MARTLTQLRRDQLRKATAAVDSSRRLPLRPSTGRRARQRDDTREVSTEKPTDLPPARIGPLDVDLR